MFSLVSRVASMNVRDDSEIDWKLLSDNDWNLWSAHSLQRRWLTLKRSIRGYEDMSHQGTFYFFLGIRLVSDYDAPNSRNHGHFTDKEGAGTSPAHSATQKQGQ